MSRFIWLVVAAALALMALGTWSLGRSGPREISPLENIHGIPFPKQTDGTGVITEKLAHADIFLREPVVGKKLKLTVAFDPGNLTKLEVGVRENSFWLSYPKVTLYNHPGSPEATHPSFVRRGNTVVIPLTDKLADRDGSIDVMFFATNPESDATEYEGVSDKTQWQLHSITAEVSSARPTWPELKDFIKSVLNQEKPV